MSKALLIVSMLIYTGVTVDQVMKQNYGVAVAYFGYAISSIGYLFIVD